MFKKKTTLAYSCYLASYLPVGVWKDTTQASVPPLLDNATYDQLAHSKRPTKTEHSSKVIPDLVEHEKQRRGRFVMLLLYVLLCKVLRVSGPSERDRRSQKSRQEILAEERDYKRRRKSWRTKNIRTKAIDVSRLHEPRFINIARSLKY
jgi:hypothetical protein